MKKIFGIIAILTCITILLIGGSMLYQNYLTTSASAWANQEKSNSLGEENNLLQEKLEKKNKKIKGQKEYISELTQQIAELQMLSESSEDSEDFPISKEDNYNDTDNYPDLYVNVEDEQDNIQTEKKVYLTFDDGPSSLTPQVLDLLDEYDAKATFFVVYTNEQEYTEHLAEIVSRGHTLALHSYSHDYDKIYASVDAFLSDFQLVFDWVYEATGQKPALFRFPGGSNNGTKSTTNAIIAEMERRGFTYYDWNVSSGDGSNLTTSENIIENICDNVEYFDFPVVLMHDGIGKTATLQALPTVLRRLTEKGYSFGSLNRTMEPIQYIR